MLNAGPTLLDRCRRVAADYEEYLEHSRGYWIALARTTPWPNPAEPALRHPNALRIPGIILFTHIHYCAPCYYSPTGNIVTADKNYQSLEVTDYYSLVQAKAHFLYYEAEVAGALLHHDQIYRIIALCRKVQFVGAVNPQPGSVITPDVVSQYEALWVGSTQPVNPDSGTLHRIQIVRAY